MEEDFDIRNDGLLENEQEYDLAIRPQSFLEFKGQNRIIENLKIFVEAAKLRDEPLDHVLLS